MLPGWLHSADKERHMATEMFCWLCFVSSGPHREGTLTDLQTDTLTIWRQALVMVRILMSVKYTVGKIFCSHWLNTAMNCCQVMKYKAFFSSTYFLYGGGGCGGVVDRGQRTCVQPRKPQIQQHISADHAEPKCLNNDHLSQKYLAYPSKCFCLFLVFVFTLSAQSVGFYWNVWSVSFPTGRR